MAQARLRQDRSKWPAFLPELCRRLVAHGAQRIYLFGSCARGEADEDSDVDLVVIQDSDLPLFERLRKTVVHVDPDWPVDLLVYTPAEFELMLRNGNVFAELISEEAILLHG